MEDERPDSATDRLTPWWSPADTADPGPAWPPAPRPAGDQTASDQTASDQTAGGPPGPAEGGQPTATEPFWPPPSTGPIS